MARHFSTLVVTVAAGIGIGSHGTPATATPGLRQCPSKVFYFFLEADVVLLQFADGDGRWREGANLLWGVPQRGLELGYRLLQLKKMDEGISIEGLLYRPC